jgi:hypothetical protein
MIIKIQLIALAAVHEDNSKDLKKSRGANNTSTNKN